MEIIIFELEHGCFYIGRSKSPEIYIDNIQKGFVPKWIGVHPLKGIVERNKIMHKDDFLNKSKEYVKKYGWEKIRTSEYADPLLILAPLRLTTGYAIRLKDPLSKTRLESQRINYMNFN